MAQTQTQADPWEAEAAKMKTTPSGGGTAPTTLPQSGNDDWKIWQKGGSDPSASGNDDGMLSSLGSASGLSTIGHAIAHPIDTFNNVAKAALPIGVSAQEYDANPVVQGVKGMWANTRDNVKEGLRRGDAHDIPGMEESFTRAIPVLGPSIGKIADQAEAGNYSGAVGTGLGTLLAPKVAELGSSGVAFGGKVLAKGVAPIGELGEGMQDLAASNLNRRYPPNKYDVARDNNPGRGMLDAGIGPTWSRAGLQNKVTGALDAVGSRIGDTVNRADNNAFAPPIRSSELTPLYTGPIREAMARLDTPFGTASAAPYQDMLDKMGKKVPGASTPIFGPGAPATVKPSDLWANIRNADENTRFNTDPEVENVNEARRSIRGGLSPVLKATDPALPSLNRTYGDLRSADTAIERSQSPMFSPKGITKGILNSTIDSVPINTTASAALNRIGGGMKNMATNAPEWLGGKGGAPSTMPFAYRMSQKPLQLPADVPGNADYGPRSMAGGGFPGRDAIAPPAPHSPMALPAESQAGDVQPMVGVRASSHPGVAEDFARTRIAPSRAQLNRMGGTTLPPEHQGLQLGNGPVMRALPETSGGGESEPMIGIRAPQYPPLAEPFARERIAPPQFNAPAEIRNNPFEVAPSGNAYGNPPKGPRELPAPPPPKTKKGKG